MQGQEQQTAFTQQQRQWAQQAAFAQQEHASEPEQGSVFWKHEVHKSDQQEKEQEQEQEQAPGSSGNARYPACCSCDGDAGALSS